MARKVSQEHIDRAYRHGRMTYGSVTGKGIEWGGMSVVQIKTQTKKRIKDMTKEELKHQINYWTNRYFQLPMRHKDERVIQCRITRMENRLKELES